MPPATMQCSLQMTAPPPPPPPGQHTVLAAEELADGRAEHGTAVGSARERRQPRPFELQLPPLALRDRELCAWSPATHPDIKL
jgi:hypothetical protein